MHKTLGILTTALVALLAVPAASASTNFGFSDAAHACDGDSDLSSARVYNMNVGSPASSGSDVSFNGGSVYFAANVAPHVELVYEAGIVTIDTAAITTGTTGFQVEAGVLSAGCVFTPSSTTSVTAMGTTTTVAVLTTVPADGFYALKFTDRATLGDATPTVIDLDGGAPVVATTPDLAGTEEAYPVPGPASYIVLGLGALAVLGRVWMVRRNAA
jgi:hypothetical protein